MSDNNHIERRLRALESEPVPPADSTFVDHLEVRLRVMHVDELGATRSRSTWIPAVVASMVVVLLAVGGALLLNRTPDAAVILTAAADTDVILPGDQATAAVAGLQLPDGTRIIVGPDGEAVVNGVVLGPGSEAMVVGAQVDVLIVDLDSGDPTGPDGSEPLAAETDGVGDGDASQTTVPDDNPRSTSTGRDVDQPVVTDANETDPDPTDAGEATVSTRSQTSSTSSTATPTTIPPRPTSSTTARGTTTSTADQRLSPLELTVERVDRDRLRLSWTVNRDADPAGWRIRVRHGDRLATVVAIRDGEARMTTIERSVVVDASVWVEALDRQGHVLLASSPVKIEGS